MNAFLDSTNIEDHGPVCLAFGHFGEGDAPLRVVAGRDRVLALVVSVAVVEIAVDDDLPRHLHRVAVDRREDGDILLWIIENHAVVRHRNPVLAVGKHVARARKLLWSQTMNVARVGDLDDLVAFHDVAAHARDPGIGLVVHEQVATVVGAVGERHVRVVEVTVFVCLHSVRGKIVLGLGQEPVGKNLEAFVGLAPPGRAAAVEHGNTHQLAHRRHADDAQFSRLATRPEPVILVELTGTDDVGRLRRPAPAPSKRRRWLPAPRPHRRRHRLRRRQPALSWRFRRADRASSAIVRSRDSSMLCLMLSSLIEPLLLWLLPSGLRGCCCRPRPFGFFPQSF